MAVDKMLLRRVVRNLNPVSHFYLWGSCWVFFQTKLRLLQTTLPEKHQSINYVDRPYDDDLFATLDLLDDDDTTHLSRV